MESLKKMWSALWENKPLAYALLAILGVFVFLMIRRGRQTQAVLETTGTSEPLKDPSGGPNYFLLQPHYQPGPTNVTVTEAPTDINIAPLTNASAPTPGDSLAKWGLGVSFTGLLGPNATINQKAGSYSIAGKSYSLPDYLKGTKLVPGAQNRQWTELEGRQVLLTSGYGPAVTNSGLPVGSPQLKPGAYR